MRVPISWLRDYVEVELEADRLAERLTLLGMEVKGVERWGADWRSVVVGELLEVRPHPNADRLSLTRVTVGGEIRQHFTQRLRQRPAAAVTAHHAPRPSRKLPRRNAGTSAQFVGHGGRIPAPLHSLKN